MFNWFKNLFKKKPKTRLGIDLGSSVIKLAEISSEQNRLKLETYGLAYLAPDVEPEIAKQVPAEVAKKPAETTFNIGSMSAAGLANLSNKEIAQVIKELISQAQAKTNIAYFSLPVFATFSTLIDLPPMSEEEIAAAIPYEARKYIPVPLEEVVLDWSVITSTTPPSIPPLPAGEGGKGKEGEGIQVILVAILKEVIEKYTEIARIANLEIKALEAESFSLTRALVGQDKSSIILIDIGSRFTDLTLVKDGFVRVIYNAKKVIDQKTGQLDKGSLVQEIERVINLYRAKYNHLENIKCILTGRSALAPNLVDYLKETLKQVYSDNRSGFKGDISEVLIGNPFSYIDYPRILEPVLKEIGPSLSVAVGLAMRE